MGPAGPIFFCPISADVPDRANSQTVAVRGTPLQIPISEFNLVPPTLNKPSAPPPVGCESAYSPIGIVEGSGV